MAGKPVRKLRKNRKKTYKLSLTFPPMIQARQRHALINTLIIPVSVKTLFLTLCIIYAIRDTVKTSPEKKSFFNKFCRYMRLVIDELYQ